MFLNHTTALAYFHSRLLDSKKHVSVSPTQESRAAFFADLVYDKSFTEQVALTDDEGGWAVLTPTRFGNVVVFERYAPTGGTRQSVADSTLPNEVRMLFGGLFSSSLTEAAVAAIVDDTGCGHIGKRIEKFLASTS